MDSNPKVTRLSSDMDATAASTDPHLGAPEGWPASPVADALYAVLHATPETARRHRPPPRAQPERGRRHGAPHGRADRPGGAVPPPAHDLGVRDRARRPPRGGRARRARGRPARRSSSRRAPDPQGTVAVYAQIGPMVADLVAVEDSLTARERRAVAAYLGRVLDVLRAHTDTW